MIRGERISIGEQISTRHRSRAFSCKVAGQIIDRKLLLWKPLSYVLNAFFLGSHVDIYPSTTITINKAGTVFWCIYFSRLSKAPVPAFLFLTAAIQKQLKLTWIVFKRIRLRPECKQACLEPQGLFCLTFSRRNSRSACIDICAGGLSHSE